MLRRLGAVPVLAVVLVGLSGCLRMDAELDVGADARATGSFTLEVAEQAAGLMGLTSGEDLASQVSSGEIGGAGADSGLTCEPLDRSGAIAVTCTFADAAFDDPDGIWSIKRVGDTVVLTVTGGDNAGADDPSMLQGLSSDGVTITARMPGPILSIDGDKATKVDDQTVRVRASIFDTFTVTVTSQAGSSGPAPWLVAALGALLVAVIAVVVVVVVRRRGDQPGSGGGGPMDAADSTDTDNSTDA